LRDIFGLRHRLLRGETVGNASDTVADHVLAEVDHKSQSAIRQSQVGEELLLVHSRELLDRLELDDDDILHDQVCLEADVQANFLPLS
jgi:hypothetical protein